MTKYTPETDAFYKPSRYSGQSEPFHFAALTTDEQYNFARNLECQRDELQAKCEGLVAALRRANDLRPMLLLQYGAVPECVLEFCNQARAALAKMGRNQ